MASRPVAERFSEKFQRGAETECWPWTGAALPTGYGRFCADGRRTSPLAVYAHRFAFELAFGPIPAGQLVCHRCDNPPCVNPSHLFLGTQSDNMHDRMAKGRGKVRISRNGSIYCANNHRITPETTYQWRGDVLCRACRKAALERHEGPTSSGARQRDHSGRFALRGHVAGRTVVSRESVRRAQAAKGSV